MLDEDLLPEADEKTRPKLPWHPPLLEKAEINHDTASSLGSGADGGGHNFAP
jgi:hypothetical protein